MANEEPEQGGRDKDPPAGKAPTADALRIGIDRGVAGDKVRYPDPAAAPLGTDDEAAGTPPTAQQRHMAARHELERGPDSGDDRPSRLRFDTAVPVLLVALVIVLVIVLLLSTPA